MATEHTNNHAAIYSNVIYNQKPETRTQQQPLLQNTEEKPIRG
jgi:hypothetical protein